MNVPDKCGYMANMDFQFRLVERRNDLIQRQQLWQQPENIIRVINIKRMVIT